MTPDTLTALCQQKYPGAPDRFIEAWIRGFEDAGGLSVKFAEWAAWNYEQSACGDGKWLARKENPIQFYTTEQLYDKYQEHLKQQ